MSKLSKLLKRRRNMPQARRFLAQKKWEKFFGVSCAGMIKYTPSQEIAEAVTKHVLRKVLKKRKKDHEIVLQIYLELASLPLKIGVLQGY